jgi:hypothetical protein
MSGALALASVTAVLKSVLENGLAGQGVTRRLGGDAVVSALPPDRVTSGAEERAQLNLFLYLVTPHVGLLNSGTKAKGPRPLALDLHYLVSAYSAHDFQTEILLGHTLELLHQTPVLERERVREILASMSHTRDRRVLPPPLQALAESTLADDVERLRIEPTFLPAEEMSKLWSTLQARYRPSVTYKVCAVLMNGRGRP